MADDYDIHPGVKSVHVDYSENSYNIENVGGRPHRSGRRGRNAYGGYGYAPDPLLYTIVQDDDGHYQKVADDDTDDDKGSNLAGWTAVGSAWPGWLQLELKNATTADRQPAAKFAMSVVDRAIAAGIALRSNPNDAVAKKFLSYATPDGNLEHPTVFVNQPNNAFWSSTPEHKADHDAFVMKPQTITVTSHTTGPFAAIAKAATTIGGDVVHAANAAVKVVGKLPVVGSIATDLIKLNPAAAIGGLAVHIAQGKNVVKSVIAAGIDNLTATKELAPYINMIVPGVGTTIASAASAGLDLAHGRTITDDLVKAASAATGNAPQFQQAFALASSNASTNAARLAKLLAANPMAQKAITTATALGAAKNIQAAVAQSVAHPDNAASLAATGIKALKVTPAIARAAPPPNRAIVAPPKMSGAPIKIASIPVKPIVGVAPIAPASPTTSPELYGYQVGVGLLAHTGVTPYALVSARQGLTPAQQVGFDHAVKTIANQANPTWTSLVSGGIVLRGNWKAVRAGTANSVKGRVVQNGKVTSGYYSRS